VTSAAYPERLASNFNVLLSIAQRMSDYETQHSKNLELLKFILALSFGAKAESQCGIKTTSTK
jgi:hypothetical protein